MFSDNKPLPDKPLIAILISNDGVEELWTLGRDTEAERLGLEWVDRLHDLLIAPRNTHEFALSEACSR
jgi:hypothetical protein